MEEMNVVLEIFIKKYKKIINLGDEICTDRFCDCLIMSGVSNWGALGLCACLVILNGEKIKYGIFY